MRATPLHISLLFALLSPAALASDVEIQLGAGDSFVIKDNTGTIERLAADEATGNVSRNGALFVHTTGSDSTFVGVGAGNASSTANDNTAFGTGALTAATSGSYNSAFGTSALSSNTTGILNSAFGRNALASNTDGTFNSAFGPRALYSNSSGTNNNAFGESALNSNTVGNGNSAFGNLALYYNDSGFNNSAFGYSALYYNYDGKKNSAVGNAALFYNTTGNYNTAIGDNALYYNTYGDDNVGIGRQAGFNQTTGSDNIYIVNEGVAGESGQIKIGNTTDHTQATIAGIHNSTSAGGIAVLVNASGALGTMTSSARFKQDVRDMGVDSERLMALRPVTFRYREAVAAGEDVPEYGLIAEEVAEVFPALVAPDADGNPYSVRYHVLAPLLLNELKKEATLNEAQNRQIVSLLERIGELESQLESTGGGENTLR